MIAASEKVRLIASDVETLRLHYAYTLRHWLERGPAGTGPRSSRCTTSASSACGNSISPGGIVAFENRARCAITRYSIIRDRNALPITRDYMAEAEARYRKMGDAPARKAAPRRKAATPEPVK